MAELGTPEAKEQMRRYIERQTGRRVLTPAERRLRHRSGFMRRSRAQVHALALEAAGHCMICKKQFEGPGLIHLDHCHATGRLRGLLCPGCNTGLGKLGDSVSGLFRAIDYLERTDVAMEDQ